MKAKKYKAIVYDLVGPLLLPKISSSLSMELRKIDQKCGSVINDVDFVRELKKDYGYSEDEIQIVFQNISNSYKKNKKMWDFHFKHKIELKSGIINNGTAIIFEQWKKKFKFDKYFNITLNSSQIGIRKPDPKIFNIMFEKLEVVSRSVIYIDDAKENVEAAKKLGCFSICYDKSNHSKFLQILSSLITK